MRPLRGTMDFDRLLRPLCLAESAWPPGDVRPRVQRRKKGFHLKKGARNCSARLLYGRRMVRRPFAEARFETSAAAGRGANGFLEE